MDLMHAKAEFEAGRLSEVVAETSEQGKGWRLLLHSDNGETLVLTDHSGRECVYHSLDHATEVGRDIGFDSVRIEEHF
ncbi:MAG: thymidylate kinase [Candidatus Thiodiazotropha sp. (ex Monitilora ramsayi)]|nr:thymidylate kinase [Candidatus Thiodiazotropha sp. (ex Monitilora ramsayi)]